MKGSVLPALEVLGEPTAHAVQKGFDPTSFEQQLRRFIINRLALVTPGYLAPEQVAVSLDVTTAADVCGLGEAQRMRNRVYPMRFGAKLPRRWKKRTSA